MWSSTRNDTWAEVLAELQSTGKDAAMSAPTLSLLNQLAAGW